MRTSHTLVATCVASQLAAQMAVAQPAPPYGPPGPRPYDQAWPQRGPAPGAERYYYNGRWVGSREWQRRSHERDRWVRNYDRRHRDRDDDNSTALVAGIIGFALGAAIVGSQAEAEHARTADRSWDDYCARKYRNYDRRSRTYLGPDGLRHYCQ